jgi:hypothetical protein
MERVHLPIVNGVPADLPYQRCQNGVKSNITPQYVIFGRSVHVDVVICNIRSRIRKMRFLSAICILDNELFGYILVF